jgi:hypothetical protein
MTLHLTNGTSIIPLMREAGIAGRIVAWNDVLHEGPVPSGLNPAALREVRAGFIASGDGSYADVARSFAERDAALEDLREVDEVVLWLEHDLYDQLQLIQILDRLAAHERPLVTAVPDDDYLGTQPASRFVGLFAARREVTSAQRIAARDAWDAFRSPDPRHIVNVLERVTALAHLAPALRRHLQQFPSVKNGLSRTEQQTLEAVARGISRVKDVYVAANHEREEAVFMGDLAYVFHIRGLAHGPMPLLQLANAQPDGRAILSLADDVTLTDHGKRVLDGEADRVASCGIERWLGGVHLSGHRVPWRWDHHRQRLHGSDS